ncbi:MAG: uroporphyrinogen-III C-methyltransferase [Zoogloeaceae bacterium]|jgi:uroporphyrin-III C-methyltransferase/precorrin-2 dehydrogenase/sirohydrochlorin ferrochelatase|nr:uroporphyrinogen-III C-methyltransferase [Zoogloeaceae bacterium]
MNTTPTRAKPPLRVLPVALAPRRVLLVGAGAAAAQKAKAVLESDCELTVIARAPCDPFFAGELPFPLLCREFRLEDVAGRDIVINATGDAALSHMLWASRKAQGYWLNCVDQPECCDFYFSATTRDHDLCVSVSTGGASPRYAQRIRDLVAACLPQRDAAFYEELRQHRHEQAARADEHGKVYLIGCGPGKREHLTLRALQCLQCLEVALIDALVGEEVVALLPRACRRINVSKRKGHQQFAQEEINAMMLEHVRAGRTVGRLKGGDPLVFGRVFEEAAFLLRHGIVPELVGGISSFLSGCLAGGIPPTLRDASAGALVVSAHLRETRFNDDWIPLLKDFPYTLIVLMAHSFAGKIEARARAHGISPGLPAAFVAQIDHPAQTTVIGTLGQLEEMARHCDKPAILVIGKAVAHALEMPHTGKRIVLPRPESCVESFFQK